MSNFYGKRFLSALMGALSVLSSPVASAVGGKLGKGNLKGEVESSAGRSKNGGKGGKLEADRKIKSVNGLKEVLKETGGKVVRVSPDGKGGFVAFVKTPRGIVTVAIVGVSLMAIIAFLVFHGRKSNKGSEKVIVSIDESEKLNLIEKGILNDNVKVKYKREESSTFGKENLENDDGPSDEDVNINSKDLLSQLFKGEEGKYGLFVKRLLGDFFNNEDVTKIFSDCNEDLDEFLKVVFERSFFQVNNVLWHIGGGVGIDYCVGLSSYAVMFRFEGAGDFIVGFFEIIFKYLRDKELVRIRKFGQPQARWGYRISAVLFGFWFLAEYGLEPGSSKVGKILETGNLDEFKRIFNVISNYVGGRLKAAGKGYNG